MPSQSASPPALPKGEPSAASNALHRTVYRSAPLKVQKQAKAIKKIQEVTLPNLRQQLAETAGIFKGKERKALEKQIQQTEAELTEKLDKLPDILTDDGYPDVQAFMKLTARQRLL